MKVAFQVYFSAVVDFFMYPPAKTEDYMKTMNVIYCLAVPINVSPIRLRRIKRYNNKQRKGFKRSIYIKYYAKIPCF